MELFWGGGQVSAPRQKEVGVRLFEDLPPPLHRTPKTRLFSLDESYMVEVFLF